MNEFKVSHCLKTFLPLFGWNLGLTLTFFVCGHFELLPSLVRSSGYAYFASDSFGCHQQALELLPLLQDGNLQGWWEIESRVHTRLASITYALWGSWTFYGILSYWPVNLFCLLMSWLAWNRLIVLLGGKSTQNGKVWLLFPILSLHFTQLLRDPLYIMLMLWWLNLWLDFFKHPKTSLPWWTWRGILIFSPLLLLVRERFFVLAQVMTLTWLILGVILTLFRIQSLRWLLSLIALVLVLNSGSLHRYVERHWLNISAPETGEFSALDSKKFTYFYKVASLRLDFNKSYSQASNIDHNINFNSDQDVLDYIPRALQIGLLAPFPSHAWADAGKTGRLGRILSCLETCLLYFIMLYCLIQGVLRKPNRSVFILYSVIIIYSLALGLVVTNIGALYRMRFVTWLLFLALWQAYSSSRPQNNRIELEVGNKETGKELF